ncbi:hypothetical protein FOZ61_001056 [Perkinsus olseni]|uniref:Uncharacterized protein n=1 Tax=Perkinsus olseni TaxID=32597 RepID=A0A7J6KS82_PEROL|nr:hypothetical protein FOZ61_001056 [Perkinsus olseni]
MSLGSNMVIPDADSEVDHTCGAVSIMSSQTAARPSSTQSLLPPPNVVINIPLGVTKASEQFGLSAPTSPGFDLDFSHDYAFLIPRFYSPSFEDRYNWLWKWEVGQDDCDYRSWKTALKLAKPVLDDTCRSDKTFSTTLCDEQGRQSGLTVAEVQVAQLLTLHKAKAVNHALMEYESAQKTTVGNYKVLGRIAVALIAVLLSQITPGPKTSAAENTFIDSDQQRYFVPTPHCVSICKERRRLNDFVARFEEKLDDLDASWDSQVTLSRGWEDWTWYNYELDISCIHVVTRRAGQLTCHYALGVWVPDISLVDLLLLGEVNKERAKYTKAKGLTPDADYVRGQLEIVRMADVSSGIGSSPQFPRDALKLEPPRSVDLNKQYREMAAGQLEDIPDPTVQQTQPPINPASPSFHWS